MTRPGGRFAGGVELAVGANVIRLIVREHDPSTFNWLADVRVRTPFVPLTDALGEPNTESSAESAQKAVRAAVSFFTSCGIHLTAEQQVKLESALVAG
jgi:hypothetical protein